MIQLKPSQLRTFLLAALPKGLPILIVGKPGIGKTSIVRAVAKELDADLLLSTPSTEDPTVPAGFPWAEPGKDEAHFKPFGNLARALKAKKLTIWFLDDLGQAHSSVQSGYMPLLQGWTTDGRKLPDCVVFVAATNERTHKAGVGGLLEPVKSRFATIIELIEDVDEWSAWAVQQPHMPPTMVAYVRFQPDVLCKFTPTVDLKNCPLPRTWENAGKVETLDLPKAIEAVGLSGAIGEEEATLYLAFREMYRALPSIDGILLDPDNAPIPENLGALYAVTTGLASKTNIQNFPRVVKYVNRMMAAARGDFAALLVLDASRRNPGKGKEPGLQQTPEFVRLMAGELGAIINGKVN